MTALPDGKEYTSFSALPQTSTTEYFPNRLVAAIFVENLLKSAVQDEISQLIMTTHPTAFGASFVTTVTINCWGGISAMMLRKLDE